MDTRTIHANIKYDLIEQKCLCCIKNYQKNVHKTKRIANTYKFANHDINNFILLLQKRYLDDWEKFNGISLREKGFYSCLNMKDILMQIINT